MKVKCNKCKREKQVDKNIVMTLCKCGNVIELEGGKIKNEI